MTYTHLCKGTCSRQVTFTIEEGIIRNIRFKDGCSGNLQGIAALAEGQPAEKVADQLRGIRCGFKSTSCPDQLADAIGEALKQIKKAEVQYV